MSHVYIIPDYFERLSKVFLYTNQSYMSYYSCICTPVLQLYLYTNKTYVSYYRCICTLIRYSHRITFVLQFLSAYCYRSYGGGRRGAAVAISPVYIRVYEMQLQLINICIYVDMIDIKKERRNASLLITIQSLMLSVQQLLNLRCSLG